MNKQSKWSEIRNDYIEDVDDFHVLHIDAWETGDDNEEGTVIAKLIGINKNGEPHIYLSHHDPDAMIDPYAKGTIEDAKQELRNYLKEQA